VAAAHPQRLAAYAEHARELDLAVRILEALDHLADVLLDRERPRAADQAAFVERARDGAQEFVVVERLDDVVVRARPQGGARFDIVLPTRRSASFSSTTIRAYRR